MLKIKRLSDIIGKRVYTDAGDLFGVIEEVNLLSNKVDGWRIVVSKESGMAPLLAGARGIIVPMKFVKSVGDVVLINKHAVPIRDQDEDMPLGEEDLI